jgi:hypothetical protein
MSTRIKELNDYHLLYCKAKSKNEEYKDVINVSFDFHIDERKFKPFESNPQWLPS